MRLSAEVYSHSCEEKTGLASFVRPVPREEESVFGPRLCECGMAGREEETATAAKRSGSLEAGHRHLPFCV
jgi:hypothetical protein